MWLALTVGLSFARQAALHGLVMAQKHLTVSLEIPSKDRCVNKPASSEKSGRRGAGAAGGLVLSDLSHVCVCCFPFCTFDIVLVRILGCYNGFLVIPRLVNSMLGWTLSSNNNNKQAKCPCHLILYPPQDIIGSCINENSYKYRETETKM